jgi:integrase
MAGMVSLTREELLALLKAAKEHCERDWLMLLVTFSHGLRVSETIGLRRDHFRDGHLTVKRLKGSLRTVQPLLTNENELLDERTAISRYLQTLSVKEHLFPITRFGFDWIVKRHCATAGITAHKAHAHVLKHTCAMLSIHKAGIENVRQYLGHRSIASTGAYLRVDDSAASKAIAAAMGF